MNPTMLFLNVYVANIVNFCDTSQVFDDIFF